MGHVVKEGKRRHGCWMPNHALPGEIWECECGRRYKCFYSEGVRAEWRMTVPTFFGIYHRGEK